MKQVTHQHSTTALMMKLHVYFGSLVMLFIVGTCHTWNATIADAETALKTVVRNWYPDIEFNRSCLVEGCPGLNNISLCPDEVDEDRMHSLLDIISGCMRGHMCGITIDKRPIMSVTVPIEDLLPGKSITGFYTIVPGSSHLTNVSNMELEHVPDQSGPPPLLMAFHIPAMRVRGQLDIVINFPTVMPSVSGQQLKIHLPNVTYDATYQFISTISLNQSSSSSRIEIEFINPTIKADYEFCGMDMPVGLPSIVQLFTRVSNELVEKSEFAIIMAKFLKRLFQSCIDVASKNCSD